MKRGAKSFNFGSVQGFAAAAVGVILFAFMLYLTVFAFFETTIITTHNNAGELAETMTDNIFLNIILLVIILSALYIFYRHRDDVSLRRIEIILMVWTLVLGAAFIVSVKLCAPWYTDSYYVTTAAQKAARGDFGAMETYFVRYPFQLGFVMYEEVFFRGCLALLPGLPDGYYCLALQGVNVLWLMLSYHALIKLSGHLFYSIRVQKMTALLMIFCLPAVLTCTFLYGNIPAYGCGITALWMFAEFLERRRIINGVLCALLLGVAVALKLNLLIFFVAVAIVWVFELCGKFSLRSALCLALTVASVFTVSKLPQTVYESRCGKQFGDGIPMLAWMAMGFSEGHAGPGWYKEDNTVTFFTNSGCDTALTSEHAKQVIHDRAAFFADTPGEAWKFFSTKLKSQWNEPTYESIWVNRVQASYGEKKGLYNVFCNEKGKTVREVMNQFQQLVFLGVLLYSVVIIKEKNLRNCLPAIVLLGGMFYHLLFEAKSQYILPYFIIMIPLAANGLCCVFFAISKR